MKLNKPIHKKTLDASFETPEKDSILKNRQTSQFGDKSQQNDQLYNDLMQFNNRNSFKPHQMQITDDYDDVFGDIKILDKGFI